MRLYECPEGLVKRGWVATILNLVNQTTDEKGNIRHLPFKGGIQEQPEAYLFAVEQMKLERAAHMERHMKKIQAENNTPKESRQ